jgi:8-hydroxy-5-deazaflavin:NADPH oxidoreductase
VRLAIVGAGRIGGNVARLWSRAGHDVSICFSRHPDQLAARAAELGDHVGAASPADAVSTADVVMLAVPWGAIDQALEETGSLAGKVVVDAAVMEAPRRPGSVYGEEYRLADARAAAEAVLQGHEIPPTPPLLTAPR